MITFQVRLGAHADRISIPAPAETSYTLPALQALDVGQLEFAWLIDVDNPQANEVCFNCAPQSPMQASRPEDWLNVGSEVVCVTSRLFASFSSQVALRLEMERSIP